MSDRKKYMELLSRPTGFTDSADFLYACYALNAANDVFTAIEEERYLRPLEVAWKMAKKYEDYSLISSETSFMFSVYRDIAIDIYDYYFIKDEREYNEQIVRQN